MLLLLHTLRCGRPAGMRDLRAPPARLPPARPIAAVTDWSGRAEQGTSIVAWRGLPGRSIGPMRDALSAAGCGGSVGERSHADPTVSTPSAITKRTAVTRAYWATSLAAATASRIAVVPDSPGDGIVREMAQLAGDELCRRCVR